MDKVIFVDFDGTITKTDTCQTMAEAFAQEGWEAINELWEKKEISTRECANLTFQLFNATLEDVLELVDTIEIDEYFPRFVNMCQNKNYPLYILSDGYDFVIERILKRYNIHIPFYANRLLYNGKFSIECPHHNEACGKCGTCKTNLIHKLRKGKEQVVYIGDGYSDTCPALKAHIVFAKGSLYEFCLEEGVKAIHYNDFKDILNSNVL